MSDQRNKPAVSMAEIKPELERLHRRGFLRSALSLGALTMLTGYELSTHSGVDAALGAISSYHYSVAHDSPENKAFLELYRDANGADAGLPNFMSVAAYDAMEGIYRVATKLEGKIDPDKAMEILKHEAFTSPRGPISIDPETRDIVQTVYLRRVDKVDGELRNVEIQTLVANMNDPAKDAAKDPAK